MGKFSSIKLTSSACLALALLISLSTASIAGNKPIDWDKKLAKPRQLLGTNNIEEAMVILDTELKKHPDAAPPHCEMGKCLKKRGKLGQAKSEFKRATEVDANYADAWYELGAMYEVEREWQLAINAFERFLSLAPYADNKEAVKDRLNFCKGKL